MFTGIIESKGIVVATRLADNGRTLEIDVGPMASQCALGASVCVSGVCLTVSASTHNTLLFDVIRETLDRSTLGSKRTGDKINIERSLRVGDRVDGHFVQGHVDCTAVVERMTSSPREHVIWLRGSTAIDPYVIPKGSIAIDGVSLTIADKGNGTFSVALIPTTLEMTTLSLLKPGDRVNLESDILVRTVVHSMNRTGSSGGLRWDTLREAGMTS